MRGYQQTKSWDTYNMENHPFEPYIPPLATTLIVGTFPTHIRNRNFEFYYSGKENMLWPLIASEKKPFTYHKGDEAVEERKQFLLEKGIGIMDMLSKCYRKNKESADESLYPILLTDIFTLLEHHPKIDRLILTSRTEVFGALGMLKTYFMQHGLTQKQPSYRKDKVLEGLCEINGRKMLLLVPYSPSPRVLNKISIKDLSNMYRSCLNI